MKKSYESPALISSGNVIVETLCGALKAVSEDIIRKPASAGAIGFYL